MFYLLAICVVIAALGGLWLYMKVHKRRILALEQAEVDRAYDELVLVLDPNAAHTTAKAFNVALPASIDRLQGQLREDGVPDTTPA
ncbi:hypothetical protein BAJUN_01650 [Bajunvirus bajun]|uniref:Uncharacterized protein n=1 Tax=Brevundimonas phage vB_BgoS-Bajun TaxID=2948594 RepID=A0A9E7SU52_9CAUD|nr:hypothetical protein BAJUN_01650 [Brevundimonas phage vB_BgoS-Bajun]